MKLMLQLVLLAWVCSCLAAPVAIVHEENDDFIARRAFSLQGTTAATIPLPGVRMVQSPNYRPSSADATGQQRGWGQGRGGWGQGNGGGGWAKGSNGQGWVGRGKGTPPRSGGTTPPRSTTQLGKPGAPPSKPGSTTPKPKMTSVAELGLKVTKEQRAEWNKLKAKGTRAERDEWWRNVTALQKAKTQRELKADKEALKKAKDAAQIRDIKKRIADLEWKATEWDKKHKQYEEQVAHHISTGKLSRKPTKPVGKGQ